MKRPLKIVSIVLLSIVGLSVACFVAGWLTLRASLPSYEGRSHLPGLSAETTVELDGLGMPAIYARNHRDAARTLGYLHGRERFFQMDLMRRQPAGELSELFGPRALEEDRRLRIHRFRSRAHAAMASISEEEADVLRSYAEGVNAGLHSLSARPFEYILLRKSPVEWRPEDCYLVLYAMYLDLQDEENRRESNLGVLRDSVPAELFDFLVPRGTEWDSPIDGSHVDIPPVPGPEVIDLRAKPPAEQLPEAAGLAIAQERWLGSNGFAVSGAASGDGRAILAGDMHLGIGVPTIWYRASIIIENGANPRRITGTTLPGAPTIVTGSNGDVAWTFTNSYGDWVDLIEIELVDEDRYISPEGPLPFEIHLETIRYGEGDDDLERFEVRETIWGPVIDEDHRGIPRALRWVAHAPEGANLRSIDLWEASNLEEAMDVAASSGIPAQNFVVADRDGRIGWTIMGAIPRRSTSLDFRLPQPGSDPSIEWSGWLTPDEYPRVIEPETGRIWSANNRMVGDPALSIIGDGGYAMGARAKQIHDGLARLDQTREIDLLAIQLDDRAVFIQRWRDLLLQILSTPEGRQSEAGSLVPWLEDWGGRASVESQGFRFARAFRSFTEQAVFPDITNAAAAKDERFRWRDLPRREHALWSLVSERPLHLLPLEYDSWDQLLLEAADETWREMTREGRTLEEATWGARNTSRFRHPLAAAIPWFGRYLEYGPHQLPGDWDMPRAQDPGNGASQRMVVSPGDEENGIFHMPGGQSGHPLSPHFDDSHQAWVEGRPTSFLPGPVVSTLTLTPISP